MIPYSIDTMAKKTINELVNSDQRLSITLSYLVIGKIFEGPMYQSRFHQNKSNSKQFSTANKRGRGFQEFITDESYQ